MKEYKKSLRETVEQLVGRRERLVCQECLDSWVLWRQKRAQKRGR